MPNLDNDIEVFRKAERNAGEMAQSLVFTAFIVAMALLAIVAYQFLILNQAWK